MELKDFQFPELTTVDIAFSTLNTDPVLLKEANEKGYGNMNNYHNRGIKFFNQIFFSGGGIVFKKDIDPEFAKKAWTYCHALMKSFAPKHEHKQAVCAMIMDEILEDVKEGKQ